jgi:hypothetical protein
VAAVEHIVSDAFGLGGEEPGIDPEEPAQAPPE